MHLIESYATSCGLKIDKPSIYEKFFPFSPEKYVIFSSSMIPAKQYDYWLDVINIIMPKLSDSGISILQLGEKGERGVPLCVSANGLTNRCQEAYLIKRSLLYFGVDNFLSQLAGHYDKKIVCIYSNNNLKDVKPYWGSNKNQELIESDRGGKKPSYSASENPKTINLIKPEKIAKSILKLLELDFDYPYETVSSGLNYINKIVETLPNQTVNLASMNVDSIIVRMDFLFDEEGLQKQLAVGKCCIVSDRPIDKNIIKNHKQNIKEFIYLITKDHNPDFAKTLKENGIKNVLMTDLPEDEIREFKIHYMDHGVIHPRQMPDIEELKKQKKSLHYMSSKLTLSDGKMYPSRSALLKNKPIKEQYEISEVIDDEIFWSESDYFCFLKKA
jgi:hypothetical protein